MSIARIVVHRILKRLDRFLADRCLLEGGVHQRSYLALALDEVEKACRVRSSLPPSREGEHSGVLALTPLEGTAKPHGAKWLAQGDVDYVVEGAWPGSVVLMEFPSLTDAQNWYDSPEYKKIRHLRINNSISDMILVEGVGLDFTVAGFARQVRAAIAS